MIGLPHRDLVLTSTRFAAVAIAWFAAVLTLAACLLLCWVAIYDTPFADHWLIIPVVDRIDMLFVPHNEHPIPIGRILFWIDWQLFSGSGRFLQVASLTLIAVQIPMFVWLATQAGVKMPLLALAPTATVIILSVREFENMTWPFQASFVPAFPLALLSFAAFAAHARRTSSVMLTISIAAATLATFSIASGFLAPAVLTGMAILLKRRMPALAFAAITLVGAIYTFGAVSGTDNLYGASIAGLISFFLVFLGAPAAGWGVAAAMALGAFVAASGCAAISYIIWKRREHPVFVALAAVIAFALLTAGAMTTGRAILAGYFGLINIAAISRYHIVLGLLYVAVTIVAIALAKDAPRRLRQTATLLSPLGAAVLAWFAFGGVEILNRQAALYRVYLTGTTALIAGLNDPAVEQLAGFYGVAGQAHIVQPGAARLRAEQKSVFAESVAHRVSMPLTSTELSSPLCGHSNWQVAPSSPDVQYARVNGRFARTEVVSGAAHVLIADGTNRIVGYGRVPRRPSDLNPFARGDGKDLDWQGHVQRNVSPPLKAWLSTGKQVRCGLGPADS